ncbi:MAG: TonB-dependent receptor [Pseudomonadota bacterium]
MRHSKISSALLSSAAVLAAGGALAQEPTRLAPIVVEAGGLTPVPVQDYGRAHSVVTAEQIEAEGVTYVTDIIRGLPGVAVSRTGADSGLTQVRLRGAEGNHTLVLIDGVEVNAPESGDFDFSALLAADVERIEVLRGPQSSLYGSNAMGGVISITTKKAAATTVGTSTSIGGSLLGGTDETLAGDLFARVSSAAGGLSLSVARRVSDGFDVSDSAGGRNDGDENTTVNLRGDLNVLENVTLNGGFRYMDRRGEFDGFAFGAATTAGLVFEQDNFRDRQELFGQLGAEGAFLGGRVEARLDGTYFATEDRNRSAGALTSDTSAGRWTISAQSTFALDAPTLDAADHRLTVLGEYQEERFENNFLPGFATPAFLGEQNRELFGLAAEYRGSFFDALDLQAAVRQDFNDAFDDATTFSASASYFAPTGTRPHASVGTGVTNPTFFEQFGFDPGNFVGNPNLEPEKSFGWDVGVEQTFWDGRAIFDVTYFQQTLDDEINTTFPAPAFIATPINTPGNSDRQGVEVSAAVQPIPSLTLRGSYTWLDAEDSNGLREVRRPRHEGKVSGEFRFLEGRAMLFAQARFVADNVDTDFSSPAFGGSQVTLDDYVVVDVSASYQATETVEIFGRVENLFDTDYVEVDGYATKGITGYAGLRARF